MIIDPDALDADEVYRLLCGIVVPRPIAWVTSAAAEGGVNLAPFSCFTFLSKLPPMIGINVGPRGDGYKDTARNIHESKEYVVNIGDESMVEPIHLSSEEHPPGVSEVVELGLDVIPGERVSVPRLKATPISMECRLRHVVRYGRVGEEFIVGEVLVFHVRDELYDNGKIDTALLRPVARLGGPKYASLGPILTMPSVHRTPKKVRPDWTPPFPDEPTVIYPA